MEYPTAYRSAYGTKIPNAVAEGSSFLYAGPAGIQSPASVRLTVPARGRPSNTARQADRTFYANPPIGPDFPFVIGEYDDPRLGGGNYDPNSSELKKWRRQQDMAIASHSFLKTVRFLLRNLNRLAYLEIFREIYQALNAKSGTYWNDMSGWTNLCGTALGQALGHSSFTCGTIASLTNADFQSRLNVPEQILTTYFIKILRRYNVDPIFPDTRTQIEVEGDFVKTTGTPPDPVKKWIPGVAEPIPDPFEKPGFDDEPDEVSIPKWADPFQQPVQQPEVIEPPIPYWLIPYRQPNPFYAPSERPERGPEPQPKTETDGRRRIPLPVDTILEPDDPALPSYDFTISGGGIGKNQNRTRDKVKRPGKGTREKKITLKDGGGRAIRIVNFVTEANDAIEAIWDAIPWKLRTHVLPPPKYRRLKDGRVYDAKNREVGHRAPKPSPQVMLADIYKNWREIDIPKAITNLNEEFVKDAFHGGLAKGAAKGTSPYLGTRPIGLQAGPSL